MRDEYKEGYKQAMLDVHIHCAVLREHTIQIQGMQAYKSDYFHAIISVAEWAYKQRNKGKKG